MHEHPDTEVLLPPGTYLEQLSHPDGNRAKKLEMAIFREHRFAFYFWNRWAGTTDRGGEPPALVSIDWHRDLALPSEKEKRALEELELKDQEQVARFSWSQLDTHNDSHLLAAAYLNLIGDTYLLKNHGTSQETAFFDRNFNRHRVFEFSSLSHFEEAILNSKAKIFLLDIDLDFFIKEKVATHQLQEVTPFSKPEIRNVLDSSSKLFDQIFSKLEGITIATEPRYCGGILKCNQLLNDVLESFFSPQMEWKHLQQ